MTAVFTPRLMRVFVEEAHRRLREMHTGLTALRANDQAGAALLWRGAHTIKGNASMMDLDVLANLAASIERFGADAPFAVVVAGADWVADVIASLEDGVAALEGESQ